MNNKEEIISRIKQGGLVAVVRADNIEQAFKIVDACIDGGVVAITLRGSISASDNNWAAMLYDGKEFYFSKSYQVHIVDRVGAVSEVKALMGGDASGRVQR